MKVYLAIITKSPWPRGRIGKVKNQDWYQTCVKAELLHEQIPGSEVLFSGATHVIDAEPEALYYERAMIHLGVPMINLGKGYETTEQLEVYKEKAEVDSAQLIFLTTWSHYLRVLFLCKVKKIKAKVVACSGYPRPTELFTDILLTFLYPVIYWLGLENWFLKKVVERRLKRKL